MKSGRYSPFLAFFLFLSACAPLPTSIPQPSPVPLVVALDPLLEPARPLLVGCLPPGYALYEAPAATADIKVSWGDNSTPTANLFTIGSEDLVFIVNPKNPVTSLTAEEIRLAYDGEIENWDSLGANGVHLDPWNFPPRSPTRALLAKTLRLQTEFIPTDLIAPQSAQMRDAVANNPGAIGYIPLRWADATVKVLAISSLDDAALSQPILASSKNEPVGAVKDWLLCVQEELGKK